MTGSIGMITLNMQNEVIDFDRIGREVRVSIWDEERVASLVRDSFQTPFNTTVMRLSAQIADEKGAVKLISFKDTKRVVMYISSSESNNQWKLLL